MVRELTASVLAALPKDKLLAVVSLEGAANSHAAILSRALGIPAVMGVSINLRDLNGKKALSMATAVSYSFRLRKQF